MAFAYPPQIIVELFNLIDEILSNKVNVIPLNWPQIKEKLLNDTNCFAN